MKDKKALNPSITPSQNTPLNITEEVTKNLSKLKIKDKLKVIFLGTPEFVLPILSILDQEFDLVAVVTTPDAKIGRKQILTKTPIAEFAENIKVPVFKPEKLDTEFTNSLTRQFANSLDLFIVASYGKIIPQQILDIPKYGSINIHPSKLPLFRGATPIQSQILENISDSAISFIIVDAKMDHGPILHQEPFTISETDTNETLHNSMFQKSAEILPDIIKRYIAGELKPTEQNHDQATFCKPFNRNSGYFDLDNPPSTDQLNRMIRAFYPWPTTWTKWTIKKDATEQQIILKFLPNKMIQPEGKKPMKWKDFLNGYKHFPYKDLLTN